MTRFGQIIAVVATLGLAQACMTTETGDDAGPTHRWERSNTTMAEYNYDNTSCADESAVEVRGVATMSEAFRRYQHCMESRGYALTSLAPLIANDRHP